MVDIALATIDHSKECSRSNAQVSYVCEPANVERFVDEAWERNR